MKRLRPRSADWALPVQDGSPPDTPSAPGAASPTPAPDDLTWLTGWLANALTLNSLPLGHMVPRADLMPPESLRTFSLDPRWMLHLMAGVLSVGRALSSDEAQDAKVFGALVTQAALTAGLSNGTATGSPTFFSGQPISGFVLRSEVIRGWPKLEARGYASADATGTPLPCARWSTLADGSMIALFVGTMASFEIREPGEGLHFGMEQSGAPGQKMLRFVAGPGTTVPGQSLGPSSRTSVVQRGRGVIRVAPTAAQLGAALVTNSANLGPDGKPRAFTSAEFALQMLEGAESVAFQLDGSSPPRIPPASSFDAVDPIAPNPPLNRQAAP